MSLDTYLGFEWLIVAGYAAGFAIMTPPLAWGGVMIGWWMNRTHPLAPRLAGMLVAAIVGAHLAIAWHIVAAGNPSLGTATLLVAFVQRLMIAFPLLISGNLSDAVCFSLIYSPVLLALLLYVLARRYEEDVDAWVGRLRERWADRREAQAQRAEAVSRLAEAVTLPAPVVPSRALDAPASPTVLEARTGEPVALPAEMMVGGEHRPVMLVIKVEHPTANVLRAPRGSLSGFFVGLFYALRIVSDLWLPLLAVFLWFFGPALLAHETDRLADALSGVLRALRPW